MTKAMFDQVMTVYGEKLPIAILEEALTFITNATSKIITEPGILDRDTLELGMICAFFHGYNEGLDSQTERKIP